MASFDANSSGEGLSFRQLQQLDSLGSSSSTTASAVTAASSASASQQGQGQGQGQTPLPPHLLHLHPSHPLAIQHGLGARAHAASVDDDARSVGSRLSNAGSTYSAATFYSFSTSNYSGFAGAGELARRVAEARQKRHYVHPQDLDPAAGVYDVDWVQDDAATACMACFAEFSTLLRRKHHCRACGRVVCSTCLRHRLPVTGLRGLQKACDDCAERFAATEEKRARGAAALAVTVAAGAGQMMRGACESISEDTEPLSRQQSPTEGGSAGAGMASSLAAGAAERKVEGEGEKEGDHDFELSGAGSAAQLEHHRRRRSSLTAQKLEAAAATAAKAAGEEPFPVKGHASSKKNRRGSVGGYLAVAAGTALAVGGVLALRNPQLVAQVVAQVKAAGGRR